MSKSRFASVLETRKRVDAEEAQIVEAQIVEEKPQLVDGSSASVELSQQQQLRRSEKQSGGKRQGKRSNEKYQSVTTFIRSDIYTDVRIELLRTRVKRDFGDLLDELLGKWLERQRK